MITVLPGMLSDFWMPIHFVRFQWINTTFLFFSSLPLPPWNIFWLCNSYPSPESGLKHYPSPVFQIEYVNDQSPEVGRINYFPPSVVPLIYSPWWITVSLLFNLHWEHKTLWTFILKRKTNKAMAISVLFCFALHLQLF